MVAVAHSLGLSPDGGPPLGRRHRGGTVHLHPVLIFGKASAVAIKIKPSTFQGLGIGIWFNHCIGP